MILLYSFYAALGICLAGIIYRMARWFSNRMELSASTPLARLAVTGRHIGRHLCSGRSLATLLRHLITDAVLQLHILRRHGVLRWLMHFSLLAGFVLLILVHALDKQLIAPFDSEYAATLNPYLFLRNLFGFLCLIGLGGMIIRRWRMPKGGRLTASGDRLAIGLLLVIIVSGFALEAVKITSANIFDMMVADYIGEEDAATLYPLKVIWARDYGVVFPGLAPTGDADLIEAGQELNTDNCTVCHSRPLSAFVSYPLSWALRPMAAALARIHMETILWYIHFLSCFAALALLPFSKFFHVIATPLRLLARPFDAAPDPDLRLVRWNNALDACVHCGECSLRCSVLPFHRATSNPMLLPAEKLRHLKRLRHTTDFFDEKGYAFAEGSHLCTECHRCTMLCPAGINLQELWMHSKALLTQAQQPETHQWVTRTAPSEWAERLSRTTSQTPWRPNGRDTQGLKEQVMRCVQCATCTGSCPVVNAAIDSEERIDFTPQQVINLIRLDLPHIAIGSRMVWHCITCYKCQELCPQQIPVTDILYSLRNTGYQNLKTVRQTEGLA